MTVRKNGAETGTLKTRMGFLIRWVRSHHGMGGSGDAISKSPCAVHSPPSGQAKREPEPITTDIHGTTGWSISSIHS
jgi:hypothetical protein